MRQPNCLILSYSGARLIALLLFSFLSGHIFGQPGQGGQPGQPPAPLQDSIVDNIVREESQHSQLQLLAHELFDSIGPRLVGTPQMEEARDWALAKYTGWGIHAEAQNWGVWRGWERGISHIDMVSPRVRSLEATQLAWCPGMGNRTVTAGLVILPDLPDSAAYAIWMPSVKGKFVMVSVLQPTGRPDDNWEQFGTPASFQKMKDHRKELTDNWNARIRKTGYNTRTLPTI